MIAFAIIRCRVLTPMTAIIAVTTGISIVLHAMARPVEAGCEKTAEVSLTQMFAIPSPKQYLSNHGGNENANEF